MKKIMLVLLGVIFLLCIIFIQKATGDEKIAERFVKTKGYKIIERKGEVEKYILEKSKIYGGVETYPYQVSWGLQEKEPSGYFGEEIKVYKFVVENQPIQVTDIHAKNGVEVYIMMTDGEVIGGYSFSKSDEGLYGTFSSLEGKSLEEITGLSYDQWQDKWKEKYGD